LPLGNCSFLTLLSRNHLCTGAIRTFLYTMPQTSQQGPVDYINRLPNELTLQIGTHLSEQHALGSLSSFTRTTRRNWQTLAGELHKTILIKSDGTIKALIAAAAEDTASTMSRWQTVKTVILDHTPSTTLCSELLRPDGSGQSTTQPILQSVERLIVTPKYMRSTHVHSSQSGPADVDAHTIHSLPTLFNIPTQLCFDSNILSATPLEVYGRYGARPWQLYFQDTPMLPSRPRNVSIHGLSTQLYLCPPDDKLTVHISFDDLLKHDCVVATPGPAHTCLVHNTSHVLIKSFSLECHH
jgi:hypothetical protein